MAGDARNLQGPDVGEWNVTCGPGYIRIHQNDTWNDTWNVTTGVTTVVLPCSHCRLDGVQVGGEKAGL